MVTSRLQPSLFLLISLSAVAVYSDLLLNASAYEINGAVEGAHRRVLLGFIETPEGSNVTFECSPSGPCIPCQYSEKNDKRYRCSETGYRIPLKCEEIIRDKIKDENGGKSKTDRSVLEISHSDATSHVGLPVGEMLSPAMRHRSLLDDSSNSNGRSQAYITYRSCIPAVNEEKLSVLGFEVIVLFLLLVSGSVVYFRKKQQFTMSGVGAPRIQTNSKF